MVNNPGLVGTPAENTLDHQESTQSKNSKCKYLWYMNTNEGILETRFSWQWVIVNESDAIFGGNYNYYGQITFFTQKDFRILTY